MPKSTPTWKRLLEALFVHSAQTATRIRRVLLQHRPAGRSSEVKHVAAICYRVRDRHVEFLLVQSRAGRWTFPKGRVEDDLSRAAAAAREAVEEAGAYGRVDTRPFVSYLHSKSPEWHGLEECWVDAHLCEVYELVTPEEDFRNPTWFSAENSKQRLHHKRLPAYGEQLADVVDRAVEHIAARHGHRPRKISR